MTDEVKFYLARLSPEELTKKLRLSEDLAKSARERAAEHKRRQESADAQAVHLEAEAQYIRELIAGKTAACA